MSENVVLKASIDKHYIVESDGITAVKFVVSAATAKPEGGE